MCSSDLTAQEGTHPPYTRTLARIFGVFLGFVGQVAHILSPPPVVPLPVVVGRGTWSFRVLCSTPVPSARTSCCAKPGPVSGHVAPPLLTSAVSGSALEECWPSGVWALLFGCAGDSSA